MLLAVFAVGRVVKDDAGNVEMVDGVLSHWPTVFDDENPVFKGSLFGAVKILEIFVALAV